MKINKNIKFIGKKNELKKITKKFLNNIKNNYKQRNISHERNLTNHQVDNINDKNQVFIDELQDLKERENKINLLKEKINNNRLLANFRIKSEKRKRGLYLSEPNLDLELINNKQDKLINHIKHNNEINYDDFAKTSPINTEYKENNYLNDNLFTNLSNIEKCQNDNSEDKNEKENHRYNNKNGKKNVYIQETNNNNNNNLNQKISLGQKVRKQKKLNENDSLKNMNIVNELKVENFNLKTKIGILKTSLTKKDKIIEELNNKIIELENFENNNINKNQNEINEKIKKENNDLKLKNEILLQKNKDLILGIESFNTRINEINLMIEKKNQIFQIEMDKYKNKLTEYKRKVILLKRRINELYKNGLFVNDNENFFDSINTYSYNKHTKSLNFNKNNVVNKRNILNTDFREFLKTDALFDDKGKRSHRRLNTFLNGKKKYLDYI